MKTTVKKLIPAFLLELYYQFWSFLGAMIYRYPSKKIKVIGVTGTNGKTTVTHLATDVLEAAGYKVASISSLRFKVGDKEYKNELKMTMPGRMMIQKFLREAVNAGCQYVVMEVTSEGIKQQRHKFIDFDVAVFTNLTPEHIESHGSFENYKKAKGELFKIAKLAIINQDDASAKYFVGLCKGAPRYYSLELNKMDIRAPFIGEFNLYNALAVVEIGLSQGIDKEVIKQALENPRVVPGRMEIVARDPFIVIVDYAHTPDALAKAYKAIELKGKLICVLGSAGGGRDKWKRPEMGKIAAHYCDEIVLTDEDPYEEDPNKILEDIEKGFKNYDLGFKNYTKVLDRKLAIKKALQSARPGDVIMITGKGAEPWMMMKDGRTPWDDREIVREEIRKLS